MADDGLGEHASLSAKVSNSSCEVDGSQGALRSSLVLSTSSSSVSDGSQAVSRCSESGLQAYLEARISKTYVNEDHTRSKVESPTMEETASVAKQTIGTGCLQGEGRSYAESTVEGIISSWKLTTNIDAVQGGGSKAVSGAPGTKIP
eukprot:14082726-Ditylum_brightwellii.AAC.1